MGDEDKHLKVSFIAGVLGKGGAEKQLIYMLNALQNQGVEVQVITLTEGQYHEQSLASLGIRPIPIPPSNPLIRLLRIVRVLRQFQPHFIQAAHFYTTLYAGAAGRLFGTPSIGAIRGDLHNDLQSAGWAGRLLLNLPSVLLANSYNARENALQLGISKDRILVLPNVIDLETFDHQIAYPSLDFAPSNGCVRVITVARLVQVKRLERFLQALSMAIQEEPSLQGVIVGDGPLRAALRETAEQLGLQPDQAGGHIWFLGERSDIPNLLCQADIAVLTSDREGFPNVLLEAMAASIPIVSTRAGETRTLVQEGQNGYLVPFDDVRALANHLVRLARSPELRQTLGRQGRAIVESTYSYPQLEHNLIEVYRSIARRQNKHKILEILDRRSPGMVSG